MKDLTYYEYNPKYPNRPEKPVLKGDSPEAHRKYADTLEKWLKEKEAYVKEIDAIKDKQHALRQEFKEDLLKYIGLEKHPLGKKFIDTLLNEYCDEGYQYIINRAEFWSEFMKPVVGNDTIYVDKTASKVLDGKERLKKAIETGQPVFVKIF